MFNIETEIFNADSSTTYSAATPFAGVISQRGPREQYTVVGDAQTELGGKRKVASELGRLIETKALALLSGEIPPDSDINLAEHLKGVRRALSGIKTKTYQKEAELARVYQGLTEPPSESSLTDLMWDGRITSRATFEPLACLFEAVDKKFGTDFQQKFITIGDAAVTDVDGQYPTNPQRLIHPSFRYYVEGGMILASLATEPIGFQKGQFIPNVWVDANKSHVTQFDGIIVPGDHDFNGTKFDFLDYSTSGLAYGVAETKVNFRSRFVTGPNKLKAPFPRDIRGMQHQIGSIIAETGNENINLPTFGIFYYLRGTQPHAIHLVSFNELFIGKWRSILQSNKEMGLLGEKGSEMYEKAEFLITVLGKHEQKLHERDSVTVGEDKAEQLPTTLNARQLDNFSQMKTSDFVGIITPLAELNTGVVKEKPKKIKAGKNMSFIKNDGTLETYPETEGGFISVRVSCDADSRDTIAGFIDKSLRFSPDAEKESAAVSLITSLYGLDPVNQQTAAVPALSLHIPEPATFSYKEIAYERTTMPASSFIRQIVDSVGYQYSGSSKEDAEVQFTVEELTKAKPHLLRGLEGKTVLIITQRNGDDTHAVRALEFVRNKDTQEI